MKQQLIPVALLSSAFLAIAGKTTRDSDNVPTVDLHGKIVVVEPAAVKGGFRLPARRARIIVVDDKEMPLNEFIMTFCPGKPTNATCDRARRIQSIDSSSGPKETLPKGL
jgi:hypothetical protein